MRDLKLTGVIDAMEVGDHEGGFFAAVHSPLIVHANYAYVTGCKCNDFSKRLVTDRENLTREWQEIAALVEPSKLTPANIEAALVASASRG